MDNDGLAQHENEGELHFNTEGSIDGGLIGSFSFTTFCKVHTTCCVMLICAKVSRC